MRARPKVSFIKRGIRKRLAAQDSRDKAHARAQDQCPMSQQPPATMSQQSDENEQSEQRVPLWMQSTHAIDDAFPTPSSELTVETIEECLPLLLSNDGSTPNLQREAHIRYLRHILKGLPARFTALDASRPWLFYWSLLALALLGEDVTTFREP